MIGEGGLRLERSLVEGLARRAGVPIVPIALTGTEQLLPIDEGNMGGERLHHAQVTVRFGQPFRVEELKVEPAEGHDERQLLADAMMQRVAELLPPAYQGVYARS